MSAADLQALLSGPLFWAFAGGAGLIALVIALAVRQQKLQDRFFEQIGAFGFTGAGKNRSIQYGGRDIATDFYAGSKNSPSRFSLTTAVASEGSLQIVAEGGLDKFLENMGLEGKIATNDPEFDAKFHLIADDEEFAAAYLSSSKKREAARALLEDGCARIELEEGRLAAVWTPFQISGSTDAEFIRRALPNLAAFAEDLPRASPASIEAAASNRDTRRRMKALASGGMLLVLLAWFALPLLIGTKGYTPLDGGKIFWESLRYSGTAMALFLAAVAAAVKGKSWFRSAIAPTLLLSALFFPLAGYFAEIWVNSSLDAGPPADHAGLVLGKREYHGRHSTTYTVYVQSWRPGSRYERIHVPRGVYLGVEPRRSVATVTTKPGYLGHEWIAGMRFEIPAQPAAGTFSSAAVPGADPVARGSAPGAGITSPPRR